MSANRAALMVLGVLLVLAGLASAAMAVDHHLVWLETMEVWNTTLKREAAAKDPKERKEFSDWAELDAAFAFEVSDARNMYVAGAAGGLLAGALLLVLAIRHRGQA